VKSLCNSLLLSLVVLVLAACGGDDDGNSSTPEPAPPAAGAPIPGGGLSVQEAIDSDLDGSLMVKGFVVQTADEVRLCSALAESFPPQCGGPSLVVEGAVDADFAEEGDVRWTATEVSLVGDVDGDVLRVSETSK
jgi:hypothetical protein